MSGFQLSSPPPQDDPESLHCLSLARSACAEVVLPMLCVTQLALSSLQHPAETPNVVPTCALAQIRAVCQQL